MGESLKPQKQEKALEMRKEWWRRTRDCTDGVGRVPDRKERGGFREPECRDKLDKARI